MNYKKEIKKFCWVAIKMWILIHVLEVIMSLLIWNSGLTMETFDAKSGGVGLMFGLVFWIFSDTTFSWFEKEYPDPMYLEFDYPVKIKKYDTI